MMQLVAVELGHDLPEHGLEWIGDGWRFPDGEAVTRRQTDWRREARFQHIGYNDKVAGRGFCPKYDEWSTSAQCAYETGRLIAANIASAGIVLPVWDSPAFIPGALVVAMTRASLIMGSTGADCAMTHVRREEEKVPYACFSLDQ